MPMTTWGSTIPNTGALRTHHLSKKLFTAAIAECVFMAHVDVDPDYGPHMGQSTTLTRISRQAELSDYSLAETDRIPESQITVTGKVITAGEFGASVPCTNLAKVFAHFDLENATQGELKDQMKLAMDSRACRAFKLTQLVYVPTGAAAYTLYTNGTAGTAALSNMNVFHLATIRDLLYDDYKVPFADGECYMGIFRSHGLRGIKEDPTFEEWRKYKNPEARNNSEIGKIEQIMIHETNHGGSTLGGFGLNKVGTNDVLGEGIVFGKDAVRYIEAQAPEIRPGKPDDFNRITSLCWYGIYEHSLVWDTANSGEAKVIFVSSST